MNDSTFDEFRRHVSTARPDLAFRFEAAAPGDHNHQAFWSFPGARYGGSVMWINGSRCLCWGIASGDLEAWEAFELSHGREPRYT